MWWNLWFVWFFFSRGYIRKKKKELRDFQENGIVRYDLFDWFQMERCRRCLTGHSTPVIIDAHPHSPTGDCLFALANHYRLFFFLLILFIFPFYLWKMFFSSLLHTYPPPLLFGWALEKKTKNAPSSFLKDTPWSLLLIICTICLRNMSLKRSAARPLVF